jgi:predicted permease
MATHSSLSDACYATLLRAYPQTYRQLYAADMRETFLHDLARVRARGRLAVIPFWMLTIGQALWFGAAERRTPSGAGVPMPGTSSPRFTWHPSGHIGFALRQIRRSPVFAATAVVSLALGLSAATLIFSIGDALLLKSSPGVTGADQIVDIGRATGGSGHDNFSYPLFRHIRDNTTTLSAISASTFDPTPMSFAEGDASERVFAQLVSSSYFEVMGVSLALGRTFLPEEDAAAGERPVAVLANHFWREQFGGDREIIGRTIRLNNTPFTVVGVAADPFRGPSFLGTDMWVPVSMVGVVRGLSADSLLNSPRSVWHTAVGRLRPGVSREAASAELNALLIAYREATPQVSAEWSMSVAQYARVPRMIRSPFTAFIGLLFALTIGLLAIVCSNIAGMLMARATARRREIATRLAIGATRGQIVIQLVTETMVLFVVGVVAAAPLTIWALGLLQSLLPALPIPLQLDLAFDWRSMAFAAVLALSTGAVFGLIPARHALRADLAAALYGQSSTAGRERVRMRQALVVAQVALSLTMVITAGLFVRSLLAAATIDPGFRTAGVDIISLDTTLARAQGQEAVALAGRVVERVSGVGGVSAVAHSRMIPLQGGGFGLGGLRVAGADQAHNDRLSNTDWDVVSPNYFDVVGLPILQGRPFSPDDRDGQPRVAIVNESLARLAFPDGSAVGKEIFQTEGRDDDGTPLRIVGVVRDAQYRYIGEDQRTFIYVPLAQQPQSSLNLFVKYSDGRRPVNEIRQAIRDTEASLPVLQVQTFGDAIALGLVPQRVAAWIAGSVGVLGLFLAGLGLYGLMAFLVEQRTREIAIRMALGAGVGQVRGMVLRQVAVLGISGALIGLAAAAGIGLAVQSLSLLIEIEPTDPVSFIGLSAVMALVLFLAGDLPARRAARTDPALTLKAD